MTSQGISYPYGHGGCCGCERDLDLAVELPGLAFQCGNLAVYLFYCHACFDALEASGGGCGAAVGRALSKGMTATPGRFGLAMTTSIALRAHGGNLVEAYEQGVRLPRAVHAAIVAGESDVTFVPPFGWGALP
jgi:hypothetical protein